MTREIVIAVDGGNSKTDLALVGGDGALLAHVRGPLSSPHHLGLDEAISLLQRLLDQAIVEGGLGHRPPFAVAELYLAGVDFPAEEVEVRDALETREWAREIAVGNDTLALLRAGTESGTGVAVVCGAGINCVGVAADGRVVRFPSLGAITGDWGGGYDVGLTALGSAARSEDGRGPKTSLERSVPGYFGVDTPSELAEQLHAGRIHSRRLIELAPLVFAEARTDAVAAGIVSRLADAVVAFARAALRRLDLEQEPVDVILGGGLLRSGDERLHAAIVAGLAEVGDALVVRTTDAPPVVGSALAGLDRLGATVAAKQRITRELTAAVDGDDELDQGMSLGVEAQRG